MKRSLFALVSGVGPHARNEKSWDLYIGVEKKGLETQRQRKGGRNKDKNRIGEGENKELSSVPFCPGQAPQCTKKPVQNRAGQTDVVLDAVARTTVSLALLGGPPSGHAALSWQGRWGHGAWRGGI
jgi:hypothetical protein